MVVLTDCFDSKRLNGPNDVVAANDNAIWFCDPHYGNTDYEGGKHDPELPPYLCRLKPDGKLEVVADDFTGSNGLGFSLDGRHVCVAESGLQFADNATRHIRWFDVADGRLHNGQVFEVICPDFADGMRCDS